MSRSAPALRRAVATVFVLVALAGTGWWADEHPRLIDVTVGDTLSLSAVTRDVVDQVDDRLEITVFLSDDAPGRVEARALLDRYESANRRIRGRVVDPLVAPGEVRRLGVDPLFGGTAIEYGQAVERVRSPSEQDLTSGIVRLLRGTLPTVCVTSGHGELDPESTGPGGFRVAVDLLVANGYDVRRIDLLARPVVPDECASVVVAFPASRFGADAVAALAGHLDDDGRVLLAAESGFDLGLDGVLADYGIELLGGTVVEGDPDAHITGDPTSPIVSRYSSANPVVRNVPPTFFVTTGGIGVTEDLVSGQTTNRLADTSPGSFLVDDLFADDTVATPGPITVAAATDRSANVAGVIHRTRLVVFADGDLLSNAFITEAGNSALFVSAIDWLTVEEDLVSVPSNLALPRPLALTDARRSYALLLTAGIIPGFFLLAGATVWVFRRPR